jgi:hypothetical protein
MNVDPTDPNAPMGPHPPGQVSNFNDPVDQQRYVRLAVTLAVVVTLSTIVRPGPHVDAGLLCEAIWLG